MTNTTFLLNVKTSFLSSFNYRKMRTICTILLTALVFYTVLFEESELIISKLSLRCMFFVFAIFSIDLYLRGMGFMGLAAYIAAMLIIICTNDNEPNNAAYILFLTLSPSSHFLEATIQPITQEESTHSTFWSSYPATDNRPQTHYKILMLTVRRMK